MDDDHDQEEPPRQKSAIAERLERLKAASFRTSKEKERVPQPLFWSLFRAELEEIKKTKAVERALQEVLGE